MPLGVSWRTRTALPRMRSQRQQNTTASIPPGRTPFSSTSRSFWWSSQQKMKCIKRGNFSEKPPTNHRKVSKERVKRCSGGPDLLDLRGQDEVVVGQPAGRVRPEVDAQRPVGEV